jgi:hypothetical protein
VVMKSAKDRIWSDDSGPLNWPPDRRIFVQRPMCPDFIVQHDDGTPTESRSTSFFIRRILGPDARLRVPKT